MTHRVRRHVDVERDILDIAAWIAKDSHGAAFKSLDAVEHSAIRFAACSMSLVSSRSLIVTSPTLDRGPSDAVTTDAGYLMSDVRVKYAPSDGA